jgi:hypothetical protein
LFLKVFDQSTRRVIPVDVNVSHFQLRDFDFIGAILLDRFTASCREDKCDNVAPARRFPRIASFSNAIALARATMLIAAARGLTSVS